MRTPNSSLFSCHLRTALLHISCGSHETLYGIATGQGYAIWAAVVGAGQVLGVKGSVERSIPELLGG